MFKYFKTELQNVIKDGVLHKNVIVVSGLTTTKTNGNLAIPEKYLGCDIMGKMWDAEKQEFYTVEEIKPESQLDRIEANTASLKADIEQSAIDSYTLELMESGLL